MIHVYFACSCFARASSGKYSGPLLPQPASKASTIANPSHFCIMVLVPFLVNTVQDSGWQRDNKERFVAVAKLRSSLAVKSRLLFYPPE